MTSGGGSQLEQIKGKLMEKQSALEKSAKPLMHAARDHRDQIVMSPTLLLFAALSWWWLRRQVQSS